MKFKIVCEFNDSNFCPLTEDGRYHGIQCPFESSCIRGDGDRRVTESKEEAEKYASLFEGFSYVEVSEE